MNKIIFTIIFFCCLVWQKGVHAQDKVLSIDTCYKLAKQNYPLVKQYELLQQTSSYNLYNISRGNWPQAVVAGQATYQSAVTSIPNAKTAVQSKDQYKLYGEISQVVYDGGLIQTQQLQEKASTAVEQQKLEVELYKLKERINQLYFGILLINEQLIQSNMLSKDIQVGIDKTTALIHNGTSFQTNLDILNAELLKNDQHIIELQSGRQAFYEILSLFVGKSIDETWKLTKPQQVFPVLSINRPELQLYNVQRKSLDIQNNLINARNLPKLNLFVQGGIGRPALNILETNFEPYYIGGLRLNWNLSGFYTYKNDKALIQLNKKNIDIQEDVFRFNTTINLKQQNTEISKWQKLISNDNEIVKLRTNIKLASIAQLQYGTINANDYLREVNAEDQARQNKMVHEIQLLLSEYTEKTTAGN